MARWPTIVASLLDVADVNVPFDPRNLPVMWAEPEQLFTFAYLSPKLPAQWTNDDTFVLIQGERSTIFQVE